jgi:hypothetical protein
VITILTTVLVKKRADKAYQKWFLWCFWALYIFSRALCNLPKILQLPHQLLAIASPLRGRSLSQAPCSTSPPPMTVTCSRSPTYALAPPSLLHNTRTIARLLKLQRHCHSLVAMVVPLKLLGKHLFSSSPLVSPSQGMPPPDPPWALHEQPVVFAPSSEPLRWESLHFFPSCSFALAPHCRSFPAAGLSSVSAPMYVKVQGRTANS